MFVIVFVHLLDLLSVERMEIPGDGNCLTLHCHHQNDSCIKIGSDAIPFKCFIDLCGKSHKTGSI